MLADYNKGRTYLREYALTISHGELQGQHPLWGQQVTYGRTRSNLLHTPFGQLSWHETYWTALTANITIPTNATIAFIGAGFGHLAEVAKDAGWSGIQIVDDSDWIDAHKGDPGWRLNGGIWVDDIPNMRADMQAVYHKVNLNSPVNLRNQLGGRQDFVITEFMLQDFEHGGAVTSPDPNFEASLENGAELTQALDDCDLVALATGGTVLHLVTTIPNARRDVHRKTLAEWKTIRPAHRYAPASLTAFQVL